MARRFSIPFTLPRAALAALLLAGLGLPSSAACPLANPTCTSNCVINWTDPTLTPNVTKVRAVHVQELRSCIDWDRGLAGLPNYQWTDPTVTSNSTPIRAVHVGDMRTAISQVCAQNGRPAPVWTDPVLTANATPVRAVHINELRNAIAACQGPSQCYACQPTGTMTCGIKTTPPVGGSCPNGYSTTQPSMCYPACFVCSAYMLSIDAGNNCFHCGTACGSIPNTCWSIVQNVSVVDNLGQTVSLNGICPYCPAPPSCWMGGFGFGKDPSNVANACTQAQNQANAGGPGPGRSSCGLNQAGNYGVNNTCSCWASCVTVANPVCP